MTDTTTADEEHRLAVLRSYGVLDSAPDERFDAVVRLAARLCKAPVAMLSLVDRDRQWFMARVGTDLTETPRDEAVCHHAIASGSDLFVVPDLAADPRLAGLPAVAEGSRFYAGAVLRSSSGLPLGTLCVVDDRPRELSRSEGEALVGLARQAEALLEAHRAAQQPAPAAITSRAALLQALAASGVAVALLDRDGRYTWWSPECEERFGWAASDVLGREPLELLHEHSAAPGDAARALHEAHRWSGDLVLRRPDQGGVAVEAFAVALRDADGEIEGFLTGAVPDPSHRGGGQVGLLESVLVRSDDAVLLCDGRLEGDGPTIVFANPAACALAGVPLVDLTGRPVTTFIDDEVEPGRLARVAEQLRHGRSVREELVVRHPEGHRMTAEVELTAFGTVDGDVAQVVMVVHDITARRAAEVEAAAAQHRLRTAAELAGIGAYEMDLRTEEVVWDARVRELLDLPPDTPASVETWFRVLNDQDRAAGRRRVRELAFDTADVEASYRITRRDGSERRLLARGIVTERDEHGPRRLVGVLVDVTEASLAADRMASTIESLADGYYAIDREWRFTLVNRRGEELLGRSRAELLGADARQAFPDIVGTGIAAQYERAMAGEAVEFEVYFPPHDRWYEIRAYPQPDGILVHFRDVNARIAQQAERDALLAAEREARAELAHAATHDPLTGLPNRVELLRWLDEALNRSRRHGHVAVLFCDVDRFKNVNDSYGHAAGDELLVGIAQRLAEMVRPGDIVARLGGDEFVVALPSANATEAERVAARLLDAFREPLRVAGRRMVTTASVGVALADAGATAETLLRDADTALYLAKDGGRDQVASFDDDVRTGVVSRLQMEHELRDALVDGQLRLHYQPAFDLQTGEVRGAEALLRWQHPTRGLLPAGAFIDLAEDTGLVGALGDWVVPTACRDLGGEFEDLRVWVNVSVRQLSRAGFAEHLLGLVAAAGSTPDRLGVEVTESALADDLAGPLRELHLLADAGVRIAIDDFGTGYSSLARLRRYPVHLLKLDRMFVADVDTSAGRAVVAAVVDLAHAVGAVALAEGVETADQLRTVRLLGCDLASGYHLARPVPPEELAAAVEAAPAIR